MFKTYLLWKQLNNPFKWFSQVLCRNDKDDISFLIFSMALFDEKKMTFWIFHSCPTLSEKMCKICTFRGTMACHWGSTLKGTPVVPFHMGTYLYPCSMYLSKANMYLCWLNLYLIVLWYHNVPLKKVQICPFKGTAPVTSLLYLWMANLYSIQHIKKARMLLITFIKHSKPLHSHIFHRMNVLSSITLS